MQDLKSDSHLDMQRASTDTREFGTVLDDVQRFSARGPELGLNFEQEYRCSALGRTLPYLAHLR